MTSDPEKTGAKHDSQAREGAFDAQLSLPLASVEAPAPFTTIIKRDGRKEHFAKEKIAEAIFKAAQSVGGHDLALAESLAAAVTIYLIKRLGGASPTVDHVHDAVERVLIQMAHAKTALAYARYRDRRARIRRLREGDMRLLLSELEEAHHEREALSGCQDSVLTVHTSDDTMASWDRGRIVSALMRETGLAEDVAELVALQVEEQIHKAQIQVLTSSLVRELVSAKLVEMGLEEYRERHRRLGVPLYDCRRIIRGASPETVAQDPITTDKVLAHSVKKEYALAEVFSSPVAEAHLRGEFHIHHLGLVDRLHRADQSLGHVAYFGVGLSTNELDNPPQDAAAMLAQMMRYTHLLEGYFAGPVFWRAANVFLAPFVQSMKREELAQFARVLVYEFSYRTLTGQGSTTPATLELCWTIPPFLTLQEAIGPNRAPTDRVYDDYLATAQQLAWEIVSVMGGEGIEGVGFPAPRLALGVEEACFKTPGYDEFLGHASAVAVQRKAISFLMHRHPDSLETEIPWRPRHVSLQEITLNLPRAAYQSAKEATLLERLDQLVDLAARAHQEKRDFLEGLLDPRGNAPLSLLALPRNSEALFLPEHMEALISVDGLNECVQILQNQQVHASEEAAALGERILAQLRERCAYHAERSGLNLRLAANEDSAISTRFATLDIRDFPKTAQTTVKTEAVDQRLSYSTGVRLWREHPLNPMEGLRLEGRFHALLDGQGKSVLVLPEPVRAAETVADTVNKAFHQTQNGGLIFP